MKETTVRIGLFVSAIAAIAGVSLLLSGCATGPAQTEQCAKAQRLWDAYQMRLMVGPAPTADELRIATAAQAVLIMYCGAPGTVVPVDEAVKEAAIGTVPFPRQPKKFAIPNSDGGRIWWYRVHPFMIIQDPTGIIRPKGLETITTGPFYRKAYSSQLYMPDQAWLAGGPGYPVMSPIE